MSRQAKPVVDLVPKTNAEATLRVDQRRWRLKFQSQRLVRKLDLSGSSGL